MLDRALQFQNLYKDPTQEFKRFLMCYRQISINFEPRFPDIKKKHFIKFWGQID